MDKNIWVYDIETFKKCFTYTAINKDTEEIVKYVIHEEKYELPELIIHLKSCKGQIGFNNINFDYPILHFIMENYEHYEDIMNSENSGLDIKDRINQIITSIYNEAQRIIESQNQSFGFDKFNGIKEKYWKISQMDLYKMWHFNNVARRQSLKGLEIAMNYPNVMESSIHHSKDSLTLKEVDEILEYNLNDVLATYEFYKLSKGKIQLRQDLNQKYNLNCINYPDSKIGEELVLKLYCQKTRLDYWETKKLRTKRTEIKLEDCIFDYISFESKEFNKLLDKLKSKVITETKGSIEESVIYKGFKYDYGSGGIHGSIKEGIYEADEDYIIIDADVGSMYPSIAVLNKLYPEHLGLEFCDVYEDILKQRIQAKKEGNMTLSDGYKLSLNSVYGKSNDEHSFLMDSLYTMKTTLNGQLLLTMLIEELVDVIPSLQMLQVNTDGLTVKFHIDYINIYHEICKDWEEKTKLSLEFVSYKKMIILNVNNYLALTDTDKIKYKGSFEIDKELHKDNSFRIVPYALSKYFFYGQPIENTIINHTNIYDFCGRQKFKGEDIGKTHTLIDNKEVIEKQQKNVRYFISNKGSTFIKYYKKGTTEFINKGYQVTIFNKYIEKPFKDYNINYDFYIKECMKIIELIESKQLTLF
jgi:hypothetical protein